MNSAGGRSVHCLNAGRSISFNRIFIVRADIGVKEDRRVRERPWSAGHSTRDRAPTYHFVVSTTNSPRAEFVDVFAQGNELLLEGEPIPRNGFIELNDAPGFGYKLNGRVLRGEARVAPIW